MKKISEHLGELIIALAGIILIIGIIGYFHAPIGNFFASIVTKEVSLGTTLIDGMQIGDIGVSGGEHGGEVGGENGGEADDPADEPVALTAFYTYTPINSNSAYRLGLNSNFANALNSNADYVVEGKTVWTVGSALPNPGATYEGLPVTDMSYMFAYYDRIRTLDLSQFDTSNVTGMYAMFENCFGLQTLKLSGWNTANVTTMNSMFGGCQSLTALNLSHFNTANVTDMQSMFVCCMSLETLNVSHFNTANVDNMSGMFSECSSLTTLDLSSFDTSNVTNTGSMFKDCDALNTILARTAADKATFEASDSFPGCTVTVK